LLFSRRPDFKDQRPPDLADSCVVYQNSFSRARGNFDFLKKIQCAHLQRRRGLRVSHHVNRSCFSCPLWLRSIPAPEPSRLQEDAGRALPGERQCENIRARTDYRPSTSIRQSTRFLLSSSSSLIPLIGVCPSRICSSQRVFSNFNFSLARS